MTNIYKNIKDVIQLKKINLRMWSLKDQIEAIIEYYMINHDSKEVNFENVNKFVQESLAQKAIDYNEGSYDPHNKDQLLIKYPVNDTMIGTGSTFLSDINMNWIGLFSEKHFYFGQNILIDFLIPRRLILNAQVIECHSYNMNSRVIGENRAVYRLFAKFTFHREGERQALRSFVQSLQNLYNEENQSHDKEKEGAEGEAEKSA